MEGDIPKGLAVEGIKEWCVSVCRSDVTNSPSSFRVVRCTASGTFQTLELFLRSEIVSYFTANYCSFFSSSSFKDKWFKKKTLLEAELIFISLPKFEQY